MEISKTVWSVVASVIVYALKLVCSNYGITVVASKMSDAAEDAWLKSIAEKKGEKIK